MSVYTQCENDELAGMASVKDFITDEAVLIEEPDLDFDEATHENEFLDQLKVHTCEGCEVALPDSEGLCADCEYDDLTAEM